MSARRSHRLLVTLCVVALVAGGLARAGSKHQPTDPAESLRAKITEVVADPERASKMLAAVDDIEATVGELDALLEAEHTELSALLRDSGSSRQAVDASLARFNDQREALAHRILAAHVSLKAAASPSEWKALHKPEMEMITDAASRSLGQSAQSGKEE